MNAHNNASSSGSAETCPPHHWILKSTKYPVVKGTGQISTGRTRGYCKRCGKTKKWESPTPDALHGIDSLVASSIRGAQDVPENFHLEEDGYDV